MGPRMHKQLFHAFQISNLVRFKFQSSMAAARLPAFRFSTSKRPLSCPHLSMQTESASACSSFYSWDTGAHSSLHTRPSPSSALPKSMAPCPPFSPLASLCKVTPPLHPVISPSLPLVLVPVSWPSWVWVVDDEVGLGVTVVAAITLLDTHLHTNTHTTQTITCCFSHSSPASHFAICLSSYSLCCCV
jgi:hypothetical protein